MAVTAANERTVLVLAIDTRVRLALAALVASTPELRLLAAVDSLAEALGAVKSDRPDVAVVDIRPVEPETGFAAVEHLAPLLPVVAVVAAGSHAPRAAQAGALAVCDKNGDADCLTATVRAAAEQLQPPTGNGRPAGSHH